MNDELLNAANFVSVIGQRNGVITDRFARIENGMLIMNNGIVAIAHPINTGLHTCVQVFDFASALKFAKNENVAIVQLNQQSLAVSGGDFRLVVACTDPEDVALPILPTGGDRVPCSDLFRLCCTYMHRHIPAKADNVFNRAMRIADNVCEVLTHGKTAILQGWHGTSLPATKQYIVPGLFAKAIAKSPYALVGMTPGESTFTVWFENGAFIKTQLFNPSEFPSTRNIFMNYPNLNDLVSVPSDFMSALENIKKVTSTKTPVVYFGDQIAKDSLVEETNSFYRVPWIKENMGFNLDYLLSFKQVLDLVNFNESANELYFSNGVIRGILKSVLVRKDAVKLNVDSKDKTFADDFDDDIPF